MTASTISPAAFGYAAGNVPHSRGALAFAVFLHVAAALLLVQLLDTRRVAVDPPLIVEILQPEPEVEAPLPKKKLPEPKVEEPPPPPPEQPVVEPEVLPEPLPQPDIPPPPVRPQPPQDVVRAVPDPLPVPVVRRPVEPMIEPPPLAPPKVPVREFVPPAPVLAVKTPSPVQIVAPPPRIERPLQAPEAPRVAPREPPRRPVPDAAPMMEIAAEPLPPGEEDDAPEPPPLALPQPVGPAPEGPELSLDVQTLTALYLRNPKPGYPAASRRLGEAGTVMVRVYVTISGEATRIELRKTSGYPRLDRAALDSVQKWKFVPAKRDDKPVDAWVLVPIKFSLSNR